MRMGQSAMSARTGRSATPFTVTERSASRKRWTPFPIAMPAATTARAMTSVWINGRSDMALGLRVNVGGADLLAERLEVGEVPGPSERALVANQRIPSEKVTSGSTERTLDSRRPSFIEGQTSERREDIDPSRSDTD